MEKIFEVLTDASWFHLFIALSLVLWGYRVLGRHFRARRKESLKRQAATRIEELDASNKRRVAEELEQWVDESTNNRARAMRDFNKRSTQ